MNRQIVAIMNPVSGRRSMSPAVKMIRRVLRRKGASLDVAVTRGPGDAMELAARLPGDVDAVLIVGGDGTVNEVVNGLAERPIPIAILRTGTENLLARALGMPRDPRKIAEILLYGESQAADIGMINRRRFAVVAGFGFDAECVKRLSEDRRGHISHLHYFWPIWRTFWTHQFPRLRIEADGERVFDDRGLALVGTVRQYGGGLRIFARARNDDGLLDLCAFRCSTRIELAAHVCRVLTGRHVVHHDVVYLQCENLTVTSPDSVPVQIDGDVGGSLPAKCTSLGRAARFLRLTDGRSSARHGFGRGWC